MLDFLKTKKGSSANEVMMRLMAQLRTLNLHQQAIITNRIDQTEAMMAQTGEALPTSDEVDSGSAVVDPIPSADQESDEIDFTEAW